MTQALCLVRCEISWQFGGNNQRNRLWYGLVSDGQPNERSGSKVSDSFNKVFSFPARNDDFSKVFTRGENAKGAKNRADAEIERHKTAQQILLPIIAASKLAQHFAINEEVYRHYGRIVMNPEQVENFPRWFLRLFRTRYPKVQPSGGRKEES